MESVLALAPANVARTLADPGAESEAPVLTVHLSSGHTLTHLSEEDHMGLAERRGIERFKTGDYPGWKSRIDQAAGFEIPVDVAWDELAVADYADSYGEFFPKVYFQPLVDALTAVTIDDLGKNAVRDGLSTIVIRNTGEFSSTAGIAFGDGVLTLDHQPHVNIDYGEERAKALQRTLESGI